MTVLYNIKANRNIRNILRKQEVGAEKVLWSGLRNKQLLYKFRRQHGIGKFIVDFYCPRIKLAIEVDGMTHSLETEKTADLAREQFLSFCGIKIIRYPNDYVYHNLSEVLGDIYNKC